MGIIENIGYDVRGKTLFKRNDRGDVINKDDKHVVDEDVSEVIEVFEEFKKRHRLRF